MWQPLCNSTLHLTTTLETGVSQQKIGVSVESFLHSFTIASTIGHHWQDVRTHSCWKSIGFGRSIDCTIRDISLTYHQPQCELYPLWRWRCDNDKGTHFIWKLLEISALGRPHPRLATLCLTRPFIFWLNSKWTYLLLSWFNQFLTTIGIYQIIIILILVFMQEIFFLLRGRS